MKILKLYSSHNRRREDVRRLRHKLRKDGVSWSEEVEGRFVLDNVIVETKTVGDKRLVEGRWNAILYQEDVRVVVYESSEDLEEGESGLEFVYDNVFLN